MSQTTCPECGSSGHYTLKDGRLQCIECRKKYTATTHRVRLSAQALQMVAQSFWRMTPACTAATEQGVNSKTLQKYYDLIRRAISDQNEEEASRQFGASRVAPARFQAMAANATLSREATPLICLAQGAGKVSLIFTAEGSGDTCAEPAEPEILGWVYAQNLNALRSLDLDHMHFYPTLQGSGNCGKAFWIFAKQKLVKYHGGFRKNFPLFMHEMAFRFNSNDEDAAMSRLMEILMAV